MTVLFVAALAVAACKSSDTKEGEAPASAPAPAGKAVSAPPAPAPATTHAGKAIRVEEAAMPKPFEITIPDGFEHEYVEDGETAILFVTGPDFELHVESTADDTGPYDASTLEKRKAISSRIGEKVERAEKQSDGYLLVYTRDGTYGVVVARPALQLACTTERLDSLAKAEAAAAVCGTLRP